MILVLAMMFFSFSFLFLYGQYFPTLSQLSRVFLKTSIVWTQEASHELDYIANYSSVRLIPERLVEWPEIDHNRRLVECFSYLVWLGGPED